MIVSRERQARRKAAIKAFDELFHAGIVDGRKAETAIAILERYVEPMPAPFAAILPPVEDGESG